MTTAGAAPELPAYRDALRDVLPPELAERADLLDGLARHLHHMARVNEALNLTRIVEPREAAIKHVLDSLVPLPLLQGAQTLLDIGSGAGFPGIPLALARPDLRVTLCESIGKKARFLDEAVELLGLGRVRVEARRAEELLRATRYDVTCARAVAAAPKLLATRGATVRQAGTLLLWKGPDGAGELAEAAGEAQRRRLSGDVALRYELPDGAGSRTVLRYRAQ